MTASSTSHRYEVFCINLDSQPDRWAHMQAAADAAGLALHRVAGVAPDDPRYAPMLDELPDGGPLGSLGLGSLCCTLAHRQAWQALLAHDAEWGLILEDDLVLDTRTAAVVAELAGTRDASIPLLKIESGGDGQVTRPVGPPLPTGHQLMELRHMSPGAGAYLIHRCAAARLVDAVLHSKVPVDHFLFYPRRTRYFANERYGVLSPGLAMQDKSLQSDIAASRYRERTIMFHASRGWHEVRQLPLMIRSVLTGWRVRKIPYGADSPR